MSLVRFIKATIDEFNRLESKDPDTLYFINITGSFDSSSLDQTGLLYLGDKLIDGGFNGFNTFRNNNLSTDLDINPNIQDNQLLSQFTVLSINLPNGYYKVNGQITISPQKSGNSVFGDIILATSIENNGNTIITPISSGSFFIPLNSTLIGITLNIDTLINLNDTTTILLLAIPASNSDSITVHASSIYSSSANATSLKAIKLIQMLNV